MKHKVKVTVPDGLLPNRTHRLRVTMGVFKHTFGALLLTAAALCSCSTTRPADNTGSGENLIIYYSPDAGNKELLKAADKYGSEVLYIYRNFNGIAVTVPKGKTVHDAMKYYEKVRGVLSVVKDEKMQLIK